MSKLSELLPAGASGKTIEAVATANIASKAPVILNSAGTVSPIGLSGAGLGTPVKFLTGAIDGGNISTTYDPDEQKVVIAYADGGASGFGTAVVGTMTSGTTLSFGTPVVFESASTEAISATYDTAANKVVIVYSDGGNSSYGTGIVGTVSGTSISFGTAVVYSSVDSRVNCCIFEPNSGKVVIAGKQRASSVNYGRTTVGTVSGTSISFGSSSTFISSQTPEYISMSHDPDNGNQILIVFRNDTASGYGNAIVAAVSGTSMTFGTLVAFTGKTYWTQTVYDTVQNKHVVFYSDGGDNFNGMVIVATTSGTNVSFGTAALWKVHVGTQGVYYTGACWDSTNNRIPIAYCFHNYAAPSNDKSYVLSATLDSGGTVTFSGETQFQSGAVTKVNAAGGNFAAFDTSQGSMAYAYADETDSEAGYALGWQPSSSNLTASNFVGIADAAISSSATGTIVVQGGTATGMSSLTTGGKYYVQDDGSLTSPDAPSAYSIVGATYDNVSFDVTQDSTITGMCFNGNGTKMYVCGESSDKVYQYSLSSAYDLSTASYDSVSLDVSGQLDPAPRSVVFNNDGSALYVCGPDQGVFQYTLSSSYDLSTASYSSKTFSVSSQELYPSGMIFNNNGASMYVVGSQNDTVYQYTLSTPFDVSTASYASKSMSVNSEQTSPTGLAFNSDGTKIFVIGESTPKINQYTLSSAYDISTGSYDSVSYTYTQGTVPRDIVFNSTGLKFFIPDSGPDDIYQYTVGGGATSSVNAGLAISTASLLLNGDT